MAASARRLASGTLMAILGTLHAAPMLAVGSPSPNLADQEEENAREPTCDASDGACPLQQGKARRSENVLLQHRDLAARTIVVEGQGTLQPRRQRKSRTLTLVETKDATKNSTRAGSSTSLGLCHSSITTRVCGDEGALTKSELQKFLSTNSSHIQQIWDLLLLPAGDSSVTCTDLCYSLVAYVGRTGGIIPPASDVGCYTVSSSSRCSVNLSPSDLVAELAKVRSHTPDRGPKLVDNTLDVNRYIDGGGPAITAFPMQYPFGHRSSHTIYTLWASIERLANLFRMYPSNGIPVPMSRPQTLTALLQTGLSKEALDEAEDQIAITETRAKAWVATVLTEMTAWQTQDFRDKWFGGSGTMSAEEVRDRVLQTMNFVQRELLDGMHFVFPADSAKDSSCTGSVVGYVWKYQTSETGYVETSGPICSSSDDPFTSHCAVDTDNKYYVYLCQRWLDVIDENSQIATLVHEASHHAGPTDVTYDAEAMQLLVQNKQLNNAANYQNFAQDVAQSSWGCPDSDEVTGLPYTCGESPCTCPVFSDLCNDANYGESVRTQCPATCGYCFEAPSTTSSAAAASGSSDDESGSGGGVASTTSSRASSLTRVAKTEAPTTTSQERQLKTTEAATVAEVTTVTTTTTTEELTRVQTTTTTTTVRTTTTTASSCSEPGKEVQFDVTIGTTTYRGTCGAFSANHWCSDLQVQRTCPITCEHCTPEGCEDSSSFVLNTTIGFLTCEDWKHYECWPKALENCPTACGKEGCGSR